MNHTNNAKNNAMRIAQTIANQIGNKALYMIGAKNLGATEKGLQFKVMRNAKKVTHVTITLNSMDTYDVEYIKCRGAERTVLSSVEGIYSDMLRTSIRIHTGLNTSL